MDINWKETINPVTHAAEIPAGVTTIDDSAFSGCTDLQRVIIPDSVTAIWTNAFYECTGLTDVTLGRHLTKIMHGAFKSCKLLKSIVIPDSIRQIGEGAFAYSGLESVVIPAGIRDMGWYIFSGCAGLTAVTLERGLTKLAESMFYDCRSLTAVRCLSPEPPSIQSMTFRGIGENAVFYVPAGCEDNYKHTRKRYWKQFVDRIQILDNNE